MKTPETDCQACSVSGAWERGEQASAHVTDAFIRRRRCSPDGLLSAHHRFGRNIMLVCSLPSFGMDSGFFTP